MRLLAGAVLAACLGAAACAPKPRLECSSALSQSTTAALIKTQIEKAVSEELSSSDNPVQIATAKIRASVEQLVVALADIRTTKQDPNSTKRFCSAEVRITAPSDLLADAETARSSAKLSTVSALADQRDMKREADTFVSGFEFEVQPTDKGDKVFAESTDFAKIKAFYGELVASSLLKGAVESARLEQQKAAEQQQRQSQDALEEQRSADNDQAKTENQLSTQTIAAVWKNIPQESRNVLIDDQRSWITKKTADCNVEAAAASVDSTEQETARLRCDSKANESRITRLQELAAATP